MVAVTEWAAVVAVVGGAVVLFVGARALSLLRAEARYGSLVSVDERPGSGPVLRSARYRLSGRPDELRRLSDGRLVPIEFKSRTFPRTGVPRSHRIQVAAYCLLVEETTGRAPPYGVLRYGDGGEVRVRWDDAQRAELLRVRDAIDAPYRGEATPSVPRCSRCPWRNVCDARTV